MATTATKQYLDKEGLQALWTRINSVFAKKEHAYKPIGITGSASNIIVNFRNQQDIENGTTSGNDIQVVLPLVNSGAATLTAPHAGLISPADKNKLDNLETSTESAITLKKIKVGNTLSNAEDYAATELKISNNKDVAFGLNYDANTDYLSIIDLNNSSTVVSRVHVLGDALKTLSGFTNVKIIRKEDNNTYLQFTLSIVDQSGNTQSKTVDLNVSDLIDVYSQGEGITITSNSNDPDDYSPSTATIKLAATTTSTLGGIKVYKNNSAYSVAARTESNISANVTGNTHRNFGVEIDKNNKAFVYCPPEDIDVDVDRNTNEGNVNFAQTFTAITALDTDVNEDTGKITIIPTTTTYTMPNKPVLSKNPTDGSGTATTLSFGGKFTAMTDTSVNDHQITDINTVFTMPSETQITISPVTAPDKNENVTYNVTANTDAATDPKMNVQFDIKSLYSLTASHHTITQNYTDHTVSFDIHSIPLSFINNLGK